jgi:hypothetical protein
VKLDASLTSTHRTGARQDPGCGLPKMLLPRTSVNKGKKKGGPGGYQRASPERRWAPIFEDPAFNIRVVQRPLHAQSGESFVGTRASVEDGKPTPHPRDNPWPTPVLP